MALGDVWGKSVGELATLSLVMGTRRTVSLDQPALLVTVWSGRMWGFDTVEVLSVQVPAN